MSKLIEKEGRYFKECNVVMLSTKDNSIICTDNGLLVKEIATESMPYLHIYNQKPQHLYITSDDEIKEGEELYVFDPLIAKVFKINTLIGLPNKVYKVIATTDKSLELYTTKGKGVLVINLPQPSQPFIKAFVKAGGIDKVLVEYHKGICTHNSCYASKCKDICFKLKTDSHNTITIKKVEEKMYSRGEVEDILLLAMATAGAYGMFMKEADAKDWIKHNLE